VAEKRRALPPGGAVPKEYRFEGENGPVVFSELFGDKQTLAVYSYMFGPKREQQCPMCTSLLSAWDGEAADVEQRIALAIIARLPIERLVAFKKERGWRHLKLYSDASGDYTRDYVSADDADIPAFNVFTRRDGTIRHFWSGEMGTVTADPGQDPRGAPDLMPVGGELLNRAATGAQEHLISRNFSVANWQQSCSAAKAAARLLHDFVAHGCTLWGKLAMSGLLRR
jgi:predicted dithiol-disulfide oxidoreductase (DUF899 family)